MLVVIFWLEVVIWDTQCLLCEAHQVRLWVKYRIPPRRNSKSADRLVPHYKTLNCGIRG
jgi:hypothetical protein